MMIKIDGYSTNTTLGPDGSNNSAVWLHGCDKHCKGCISSRNSLPAAMELGTLMLAMTLTSKCPDTVVISGGEPFMQEEALDELTEHIKLLMGSSTGIMIYTGRLYEELVSETAQRILGRCDLLVDGEYIRDLDDSLPYRGSSNQRLIFLTERYKDRLSARERRAVITVDGDIARLDGIPSREQEHAWLSLKGGAI